MLADGLSARTVVQCYRIVSAAFRQATKWQVLSVNPAAAASPPRPDRPRLQVPDWTAVMRLLETAEGTILYVPLVLLSTTGMRRGEVLGLRWADVDLDNGLVRIVQTVQSVGQSLAFMEPKTDRSRRAIDLPASTVEVLRRHRREQLERRLLFGEQWQSADLVLDRGDGGPVHPDVLSRGFHRLTRRNGLAMRLHDLRHAHATELLRAGVHPKVVSERLGHASTAFTMDTYSHLLGTIGKVAAEAIERAMGGVAE
jgi:integrase